MSNYTFEDGLDYARDDIEKGVPPCPHGCKHPAWIPTATRAQQRRAAMIGDSVCVAFALKSPTTAPDCLVDQIGNTPIGGEQMWVTITRRKGDNCTGILTSHPHFIPGLNFGATVDFPITAIAARP